MAPRSKCWLVLVATVVACLVTLSGCDTISGCEFGATRCRGNVVEKCNNLTGWERAYVCTEPETCRFDDGNECGTPGIACCGQAK